MHTVGKSSPLPPAECCFAPPLDWSSSLFVCSFAAVAEIYPVNGFGSQSAPGFPSTNREACISLKTFGTEAVSRKSIPELIIFTKDKRYDVKGDDQNETTIKSINAADGGFWITGSPVRRKRWMFFRRKAKCFLAKLLTHSQSRFGMERPSPDMQNVGRGNRQSEADGSK